jgi:DNA-directed RNA polymerase specialized sigma24 family protein
VLNGRTVLTFSQWPPRPSVAFLSITRGGTGGTEGGGERAKLVLDEGLAASYKQEIDLIALDKALLKLAARNEQQARIVEMRFFAGFTIEETASVMGVSSSTVEREWRYARAWLHGVLSAE